MPGRVLLVAFHFPPVRGSSAVHRALSFARHLPERGWEPAVLTAHPRAYPDRGDDLVAQVPAGVPVVRAFALHAPRHLSVGGHYPIALALPDEWSSWWLGGLVSGLPLVRRFRPHAIWSTYPIATAHCIAATLARRSGLPWVADFRDPMTEGDYPPNPWRNRVYRRIERLVTERASRVTFTTPGLRRLYADRFPAAPSSAWSVLQNGYDEDLFLAAESPPPPRRAPGDPLVLVHSGILYPSERDPSAFYAAVAAMLAAGEIRPGEVRIKLRATGHDAHHRGLIDAAGCGAVVALEPALPYREALREMLAADGLLVFQAANCNHQIPAKIYEYFRARRPILALTDPAGDTADALHRAGVDAIAPLDGRDAIRGALSAFLAALRRGEAARASESAVLASSRRALTGDLGRVLDAATRTGPGPDPRRYTS